MIEKLWEQIKQPTTKKGIIALAGFFGIVISPENWKEISSVAVMAYGVYQVVHNENKK